MTYSVRAALVVLLLVLTPPATGQDFQNFLEVSPFADGDHWFLTTPLRYDVLDSGVVIEVPAGFVTDMASIPRPFWTVLPRWGKYGPPAVVHDFLYWDQRCTREQADRIMQLAMLESDVGGVRTFLIHRALRLGGFFAWRGNQGVRDEKLVRRIPREHLPTNPQVGWSELQESLRDAGLRPEPRPSEEPAPAYCERADRLWIQRFGPT